MQFVCSYLLLCICNRYTCNLCIQNKYNFFYTKINRPFDRFRPAMFVFLCYFSVFVVPGHIILTEILNNFSRNDQSGSGWYKCSGAGDISAYSTLPGTRRTDTVFPAADGRIFQRSHRLFRGINHFQVLDPPLAAFRTHHPCQRTYGGFVDLLPAPMAQIIGVPAALACSTRASFPFTVSMASTI